MNWRSGSKCEASACIEVAFNCSSKCEHADCIEVARGEEISLRDSKRGENSPILKFPKKNWKLFLEEIKNGSL